jgi:phage gpG-like protein
MDPIEPQTVQERGVGKKKIPGHIVINKNPNEKALWYVVHTTSGHEVRVAETLRQRVETSFEAAKRQQLKKRYFRGIFWSKWSWMTQHGLL